MGEYDLFNEFIKGGFSPDSAAMWTGIIYHEKPDYFKKGKYYTNAGIKDKPQDVVKAISNSKYYKNSKLVNGNTFNIVRDIFQTQVASDWNKRGNAYWVNEMPTDAKPMYNRLLEEYNKRKNIKFVPKPDFTEDLMELPDATRVAPVQYMYGGKFNFIQIKKAGA